MKRESKEEHYDLLKWKCQLLYFKGDKWVELCRIDNYTHDNKQGSHIHTYKNEMVKWKELTFEQAEKIIKEIGSKIILQKFNKQFDFE